MIVAVKVEMCTKVSKAILVGYFDFIVVPFARFQKLSVAKVKHLLCATLAPMSWKY